MEDFKPFADNEASIAIGGLTVENGSDHLAIYGTADIRRDQGGFALAKQLLAIFDEAVKVMEKENLPDKVASDIKPTAVKSPFA
jgi:hypothetical protein